MKFLLAIDNPQEFDSYTEYEEAVIASVKYLTAEKWDNMREDPRVTDAYDRFRDNQLTK